MKNAITYKSLGLIDYNEALKLQEDLVKKRYLKEIPDTVLFCSHPPVVTLGRSSTDSDVSSWDGQVVPVSRGGRATYHGPGQIIIYPILDLRLENRQVLRPKDVMSYLETFEQAVLSSLKDLGLESVHLKEAESFDENGKKLLNRGIWIKDQKIAAFGISIRRWVTFHGCAINFTKDKNSFQGINPCGYQSTSVGYLEDSIVCQKSDFEMILKKHLQKNFS